MRVEIGFGTLELSQGDITVQNDVDAIVNAANSRLAGGGGVDGAIHRAGGPEIMQETARNHPNGCLPGHSVVTCSGRLAARFIIHTVGPVWQGGGKNERDILRDAYRSALELARSSGCNRIALPALSTGAYRFPMDLASEIAIDVALESLRQHPCPDMIRFVLFDEGAYGAFARTLEQHGDELPDDAGESQTKGP